MRLGSLTCLAGIALCAGAASAQTTIQSMDELYIAAKTEGQVVFGGAIKAEHVQKLSAAFNQRYPGIAVKYPRAAG